MEASKGQTTSGGDGAAFNGKYLVSGSTHRYAHVDEPRETAAYYASRFTCIPSAVPFRPRPSRRSTAS